MIGFGDVQLVLVLYISSVQYSVQVQWGLEGGN